jgi:hypothetical protein
MRGCSSTAALRDIGLIIVMFKLLPAGVDTCTEVNCLIIVVIARGYVFIRPYGGALG